MALRLRDKLTIFFAVYIVALSFLPLLHVSLLAQQRWTGYGYGSYIYRGQPYFIFFNDPFDGSSKPHIYVAPRSAPAMRVSLIEFSDWTSFVEGYNLFYEFDATVASTGRALVVTYAGPDITFRKAVEPHPDGVRITLTASRAAKVSVSLWRWVMSEVNGFRPESGKKPIEIPEGVQEIGFKFSEEDPPSVGYGIIRLSRAPALVKAWPHAGGFNRITVDYEDREMVISVSGGVEVRDGRQPQEYILSPGDTPLNLEYILPAISIAAVAIYVLVDRFGRAVKAGPVGAPR